MEESRRVSPCNSKSTLSWHKASSVILHFTLKITHLYETEKLDDREKSSRKLKARSVKVAKMDVNSILNQLCLCLK